MHFVPGVNWVRMVIDEEVDHEASREELHPENTFNIGV